MFVHSEREADSQLCLQICLWEQAREETNLSRASDWAAAVSATPELAICDSLAEPRLRICRDSFTL